LVLVDFLGILYSVSMIN